MLTLIGVYLYLFLYSALLSLVLIPVMRKIALKYGVIAVPKKDRFHEQPTPLLGGVAIITAFYFTIGIHLVCIKLGLPVVNYYVKELMPYCVGALRNTGKLSAILGGGVLLFLLGLIDDLTVLGAKRKFFFELAVGIFLYAIDVRITVFPYGFLNFFATVMWVVVITNAFNLLDNIDGLAAGVAGIAACMLLIFCILGGQVLIAMLLVVFIGAVLGFLRYNYSPASIFMGDSGSLFIGFFMSTVTIMSTFYYDNGASIVPIVAPLMVLSVPIYDTLSVIAIRLKNRQSLFVGDKNHFSHRLLRIGMTTREAVTYIYVVGLSTGIGALSLFHAPLFSQYALLIQTILLIMLLHHLKNVKHKNNNKKEGAS